MDEKHECEICGRTAAGEEVVTETFDHRGRTFAAEIAITRCDECGEEYVTPDQSRANDARVASARAASLKFLSGEAIRGIRAQLHLTQEQAGSLLGGGPSAFAKYESGTVMPSKSMDVLLRLLAKHPRLLCEISEETPVQSHWLLARVEAVPLNVGRHGQFSTDAIFHFEKSVEVRANSFWDLVQLHDESEERDLQRTLARVPPRIFARKAHAGD